MGVLEFIASLFSSLGWPLAAVALALIFRRPVLAILSKLVQRMDSLQTVKAGVFEAAFAEVRTDLLQEINTIKREEINTSKREEISERGSASQAVVPDIKPKIMIERANAMADLHPREAVLLAARALDLVMNQTMEDLNIQPTGGFGRDVWQLWDIGAIAPVEANLLTELQQLQNVAAHETAENISAASALDYIAAVESMIMTLRESARRHRHRSSQSPPR